MPNLAELVIINSLLYILYLMTRSDPNWMVRNDRRHHTPKENDQ